MSSQRPVDPIEPLAPVVGDAATATTSATVIRGGAWNLAGQVLPQIYTIIISVLAARILHPSGMGRLSFIAFVEATMILALTAGLPSSLMRYIGQALGEGHPDRVRGLLRWAWRIETVAAVIGGSILVVSGLLGVNPASAWVLAGAACFASIMQTVPAALLTGAQRWRAATMVGLVTGTAAVALKVFVLSAGGGIPGLFLVDAITTTANLVVTGYLCNRVARELSSTTTTDHVLIRTATRFALVSSLYALLDYVIWRRTELFFLAKYSSSAQIALYSIPFSLVTALLLVQRAIGLGIGPAFATLYGARQMERIRSGYARTLRLITTMTLPVTALSLVLGPAVLRLVYGNAYSEASNVLLILLATFPIIPLMTVSTSMLFGIERQWPQVIIGACAAVANIGLDLALIPRYNAIGAAIANTIAQLLGSVPLIIVGNRAIGGIRWHTLALARTALAAAAAGLVALILVTSLGDLMGLMLGLPAAIVTFALLAVSVGMLSKEDATWLETTFGSRLSGRVGVVAHRLGRL